MKKFLLLTNLLFVVLVVSTPFSCKPKSVSTPKSYTFAVASKSNSQVTGNVTVTESTAKAVTIRVKLSKATPGNHGVHLHAVGDCSSADALSAGPHWDPKSTNKHGFCENGNCQGNHGGDMGNLVADANGQVDFTFTTTEWCINCSDSTKNINRKALVIHDKEDDLTTQSTGNSGGRVGCAVLNFEQ